jgi:hypothetical protein
VERVKSLFLKRTTSEKGVVPMIQNLMAKRAPFHWGGLCDPFDGHEERYQVGLELLRFLRAMNYPTVLCTKGVLMTRDPWRSVLMQSNFRFQQSIITQDPVKVAVVDAGCPDAEARFEAMRVLAREMGLITTLRLRPIIPGIVTPKDCVELIRRAHACGAVGVSTEFFCVEARGEHNRERYAPMNEVAGIDIFDFYRKNSPGQSGYLRLNPEVKNPYFDAMESTAKSLGMRFAISDFHGKERNNCTTCCAVYWDDETQLGGNAEGPFINYGTLTRGIQLASRTGFVSFGDVAESLDWAEHIVDSNFQGYMCSNLERSRNRNKTLKDALQGEWNDPNNSKSPHRYTYGQLKPIRVNDAGDVVYQWVGRKPT